MFCEDKSSPDFSSRISLPLMCTREQLKEQEIKHHGLIHFAFADVIHISTAGKMVRIKRQ